MQWLAIWHYHWLQWLVMILMNIEYNVWLGHDSTTLCDSTRLETPGTPDLTRALISDSWLDLHDSWLDSGLVPSDSSTALVIIHKTNNECPFSDVAKSNKCMKNDNNLNFFQRNGFLNIFQFSRMHSCILLSAHRITKSWKSFETISIQKMEN